MNPKNNYLTFCLFLLLWNGVVAQKPNLARDFTFLQEKEQEYGEWLGKIGLNAALQTDRIRMRPILDTDNRQVGIDSTEMEMFLLLRTTDPDSAVGIWKSLKKAFDSPDDSLENYLYRAFVHKMEIPGVQGNIQIYVRDHNGDISRCFHVWIWQETDPKLGLRLKSEYNFQGCRAKSFEITVRPPAVKTSGKAKSAKVSKPKVKTANQAFEVIRKYAVDSILRQPRYRIPECNDRVPRFENDSLRSDFAYHFTLANLGREVLTNQYRSTWEKFWGYNTIAMERLTFDFEYIPLSGQSGFLLKCKIDGKYGSGVFKPRTSGYMNMEDDFNDFFETYKDKIRLELQKRL